MASIHVDVAADVVIEAIMYLPRHADWATHDLKIEAVDDSPLAVGKAYTSSHKGKAPDQVTVTELVPGQRFGFRSVMTNGLEMSHTDRKASPTLPRAGVLVVGRLVFFLQIAP